MKNLKKGFSIELFSKSDIENYTVYFEEKNNKVTYCYLYDSFLDMTFRAKAICHNEDKFDTKQGRVISFNRCIDKRSKFYDKLLLRLTRRILETKNHSHDIIKKGFKFINEN